MEAKDRMQETGHMLLFWEGKIWPGFANIPCYVVANSGKPGGGGIGGDSGFLGLL